MEKHLSTPWPKRFPGWLYRVVAVVLAAVLLEVFFFNYQYWQTRNDTPKDLISEPATIENDRQALDIDGLNISITTLYIHIEQPADQLVYLKIELKDEGKSELYKTPITNIYAPNEMSRYINFHAYGNVTGLHITFPSVSPDDDTLVLNNTYPIVIDSLQANTPVPFDFMPLRVLAVVITALVLMAFRPKSLVWRLRASDPCFVQRASKICTTAACLVFTAICFFSHEDCMQVATSFYNEENWDGSSIINIVEPDWYHTYAHDEYTELAKSFAKGKLTLPEEPPAWLETLDNVWDTAERGRVAAETGIGYKTDASYYNGHYYVYFGALPVIVFYLPFYLLTGQDLPNGIVALICCILFMAGLAYLLRCVVRRLFPQTKLGVYLLILIGVFAGSGILLIAARPSFYVVPLAFALMLLSWALALWFRGFEEQRPGLLALGTFLAACIAGARPTIALVPLVLAIGIIVYSVFAHKEVTQVRKSVHARHTFPLLAAFIIPAVPVAAALMWYNAMRFGSPFDFGELYNLTSNDMSLRGFVPERLVDGLFMFLLQPPELISSFPFIEKEPLNSSYIGRTIYEYTAGGALATVPFLWGMPLCLAAGGAHARATRLLVGFFAAAAVVLCCIDTELAGILGRYLIDFSVFFALAAALAFLQFFSEVPDKTLPAECTHSCTGAHTDKPQEAFSSVWSGLSATEALLSKVSWGFLCCVVFASVIFCVLLFFYGMSPPAGHYSSAGVNPDIYENLRQLVEFWT